MFCPEDDTCIWILQPTTFESIVSEAELGVIDTPFLYLNLFLMP